MSEAFLLICMCLLLLLSLTGQINLYQSCRIRWFLGLDKTGASYTRYMLLDFLRGSRFWGAGNIEPSKFRETVPEYNEDYVLAFLAANYGYVTIILGLLLIGVLLASVFYIVFKQKNELGMMMGCGCNMVFLILAAMYILENAALLPQMVRGFLLFREDQA